jgi:hypothetical protein
MVEHYLSSIFVKKVVKNVVEGCILKRSKVWKTYQKNCLDLLPKFHELFFVAKVIFEK